MKAIIYYRKSTDRDDKQANSLEHQLNNCRSTLKKHSLESFKEIGESRSAKTEWTRPWFNELIKICKTWKIDYIVIDEPKRLSRNNIDTSRIIDLMDKKQIKWILWTSREYRADNSRDKFLLQLDLSLSKMDNEDRSKDVKEKMLSCMNNTWRFLWKVPFWYKNITIKKGYKDIIVDKQESKLVKEIFALRIEWKAFTTIARILKEKYAHRVNFNFKANRIHWLTWLKFYYGVFTWDGKDYIWTHKAIITKEIYDQANNIWKWVHEKTQTLQKRKPWKYYLKGFVKDPDGMNLTAYIKKWNTYYNHQPSSNYKININEKLLFEKIGKVLKQYDCIDEKLKELHKDMIFEVIKQVKTDKWDETYKIDLEIWNLKNKQNKLLDLQLEERISQEIYTSKYNQLQNEIVLHQERKDIIKNDDFEKKTQIMFELAGRLYKSYFRVNNEWKNYIARKLMLELFVNTKKELRIEKTSLFKSSNFLKNLFGAPKKFDIWTFKEYLTKVDLDELEKFYKFIKNI